MLSPSQKGVRRGAAAGIAITAGSLALAIATAPGRFLPHGNSSLAFALAWVLAQGEDIVPIPGTKRFVVITPESLWAHDALNGALKMGRPVVIDVATDPLALARPPWTPASG